MNIIEKGTRQQMDAQEKIRNKAGKKWIWLVAIGLGLIIILSAGLFFFNILSLAFAPHDYLFIGIFVLALAYCLVLLQRLS